MAPAAAAMWDSPGNRSVCVMDASGLLGGALVGRLLQRGYTVHAALHSRGELQVKSTEKSRLRVFQADPLDYHSVMDAVRGCSALFYSFELPPEHPPTYDEFTSELEVRAAHNVLEACAQTDTIEKIVFTSSATAVIWRDVDHHHGGGGLPSSDFDERSWSDINFCRKFKLWHGLSKTMAEKNAWALAMDRGLNMVSVNGGLLVHPKLTAQDPYLSGAAEMFKGGIFVTVDLKFLAKAHICAFEDPSSYGRYLCFSHVINRGKDVVDLAKVMLIPSSRDCGAEEDDAVYEKRISSEKLGKLMVDFDGGGDASSIV